MVLFLIVRFILLSSKEKTDDVEDISKQHTISKELKKKEVNIKYQ
ncbi:unnamed protein product [marine sediment metagenome]|uniref:Uncharacterized protein n=1 Tax=marine sediment metagenome TaxID=412755 RepID=X1IGG3_9ZZZZ